MLKKDITFTNFDDVEVTETWYFNLTKTELAEMELSMRGGFSEVLKTIGREKNPELVISTFKEILLKTVGKRSEDGRRFMKNQEIRDEFVEIGAYDTLFMEMITDADAAAKFINGVMPKDLVEETMKEMARQQVVELPDTAPPEKVLPVKKLEDYTPKELAEMDSALFQHLVGTDPRKMTHDHLVIALQRKSAGKDR